MTEDERISEAEREVLLAQYDDLRESVRTRTLQNARRVTSGVAGAGAVAGYALIRDSEWLLAVVPFLLGIVVIQTANNYRWMSASSCHVVDIEDRLSSVADEFCWERKYGGFGHYPPEFRSASATSGGSTDRRSIRTLSKGAYLNYSLAVVGVFALLLTAVIGLAFWGDRPQELSLFGWRTLLATYLAFGLYLLSIGWFTYRYVKSIAPPKRKLRTEERPSG
jgi:hypothetical protein